MEETFNMYEILFVDSFNKMFRRCKTGNNIIDPQENLRGEHKHDVHTYNYSSRA